MTTGKIKIDPYATSHPPNEGTSLYQLIFKKIQVNLVDI